MNRIIVVGSGWAGSIIAREIVDKLNRNVTLVEKRNHIAGNMYDEYDEHGILIQKYGSHTLYSNDYETFEYVLQFCELYDCPITSKTWIDGKYINSPYNFRTMIDLIGLKKAAALIKKLRDNYGLRKSVSIYELLTSIDSDIVEFAELLFEKVYRNYIATMWGAASEKIDRDVINRTQFLLDFSTLKGLDFNYNPIGGYTKLFENILDHRGITVELNKDALDYISFDEHSKRVIYNGEFIDCIIYTGPIDELFACRYGALPYRTLDIRYEYFDTNSKLPTATVYYPQGDGYIRSNEFRKMMLDDSLCVGTIVSTEYPIQYSRNAQVDNEPYYPVLTAESRTMFAKYAELAKGYNNLFTVGRLADFKYYDMWKVIERSREIAARVISYVTK